MTREYMSAIFEFCHLSASHVVTCFITDFADGPDMVLPVPSDLNCYFEVLLQ